MAEIHATTLTPGKLELLSGWLPRQRWCTAKGRAPHLRKLGGAEAPPKAEEDPILAKKQEEEAKDYEVVEFAARAARRAVSSLLARQALLSSVFAALVLGVLMFQAYRPYVKLQASLNERAGLERIRDAQHLLESVARRQLDPYDAEREDLAVRVARVLAPYSDGIVGEPGQLAAIAGRAAATRANPSSEVALAGLADAMVVYVSKLSDASQLTYDDDIDAINLGDAYAAQLPLALERAANAAALANHPVQR